MKDKAIWGEIEERLSQYEGQKGWAGGACEDYSDSIILIAVRM